MSILALISDQDKLSATQAAQQIDMLRRAQDYVRASDALDDLINIRQSARMVKEWVRIHNAAQAVALEACKLDWLVLRKIGGIDPSAVNGGHTRIAARWLAGLSQDEFDERLADMKSPLSPITAQREADRDAMRERLHSIGRGETFDGRDYDLAEIADAVDTLLSAAQTDGMASTAALREQLRDALEPRPDRRWADELVNEGIEQVIRQAFRSQSLPDGYPAWVTWYSQSAGWVHVPWDAGTLEQLEWMAGYRRSQVADLAKSARQLDGLVRIMRVCSRRLGGAQRLDVLRRAREQAQDERDRAASERARATWAGYRPPPAARPLCTGTVKMTRGTRPCRNPAEPGSERCMYHQK